MPVPAVLRHTCSAVVQVARPRPAAAAAPVAACDSAVAVPVLDIAAACEALAVAPQTAAEWARITRQLAPLGRAVDLACRTSGFFCVTGHGCDGGAGGRPAAITRLVAAADRFFALPAEVKLTCRSPPMAAYGYQPLEAEALARSEGGAAGESSPDAKETIRSLSLPRCAVRGIPRAGSRASLQALTRHFAVASGRLSRRGPTQPRWLHRRGWSRSPRSRSGRTGCRRPPTARRCARRLSSSA